MDRFIDKEQARAYSIFRIPPPADALNKAAEFLEKKINPPFKRGVDVGCGTGVSTKVMSHLFLEIIGTDVSESQLFYARGDPKMPPNVKFFKAPAENLPIGDHSAELIMASHALHWFDLNQFFKETKRVLLPNGVLAVWCDVFSSIVHEDKAAAKELSELYAKFEFETALPYWDKRNYISYHDYKEVDFPFSEVQRNLNVMHYLDRTIGECISWFLSWSPYIQMLNVEPEKSKDAIANMRKRAIELLGSEDVMVKMEMKGVLVLCRNC